MGIALGGFGHNSPELCPKLWQINSYVMETTISRMTEGYFIAYYF
jgi:hypothetical protein